MRYFFSIIVIALLIGCNKKDEVTGPPYVPSVVQYDTLSKESMNYGWGFLNNVVINNDAEYDSIVRKRSPLVAAIDFKKYTLLGQHAGRGGCIEPGCKITILRNDIEKKYVYNVCVLQYGSCQLAHLRYQWVLISKILPGYTEDLWEKGM